MKNIDLSFNLSSKAEALLKLLEDNVECVILDAYEGVSVAVDDLDHLEIRTAPLYNCRERGICLCVSVSVDSPSPRLLIFFAEHRNSDGLIVLWDEVNEAFLNPPTINDFSEESYKKRIESCGDDLAKAASFICNMIGDFHKRHVKEEDDA